MRTLTEDDFREENREVQVDGMKVGVIGNVDGDLTGVIDDQSAGAKVKEGDREVEEEIVDDGKPKPLKYKSQEEAEKAYHELERKLTEQGQELGRLRKVVDTTEVKKDKTPAVDPVKAIVKEVEGKIEREIAALGTPPNPQDEDYTVEKAREYNQKSRNIWLDNQAELSDRVADYRFEQRSKTSNDAATTANTLLSASEKAGLKDNDELEYVAWRFGKTDPSLPLQERVNAAVKETRTHYDGVVSRRDQEDKRERQNKDRLEVLGRGSNRPPQKAGSRGEDKPTTMAEDMKRLRETRKTKEADFHR